MLMLFRDEWLLLIQLLLLFCCDQVDVDNLVSDVSSQVWSV